MKIDELGGFTPGPWVVDDGVDSAENMIDVLKASIGTDQEWIAVGFEDGEGYAESVAYCHTANAALIAAAPDLLAEVKRLREVNAEMVKALKAATLALEMLDEGDTIGALLATRSGRALDEARAALARASEGKP